MRRTKQIVHIGLWTEFCLTGTRDGDVTYEKCLVEGHQGLRMQQWARKAPGVLYHKLHKKCLHVSPKTHRLSLRKCSEVKDEQRFHFEIL